MVPVTVDLLVVTAAAVVYIVYIVSSWVWFSSGGIPKHASSVREGVAGAGEEKHGPGAGGSDVATRKMPMVSICQE